MFACGKWLHLGSLGSSEIAREDGFEPRFSLFICSSHLSSMKEAWVRIWDKTNPWASQVSVAVTETRRLVWCDCWGGQTRFAKYRGDCFILEPGCVNLCRMRLSGLRSQGLPSQVAKLPQGKLLLLNIAVFGCTWTLSHVLQPYSLKVQF